MNRLITSAYVLAWAVVKAVPERLVRLAFDLISDALWLRHGRSVRQLERNLHRVAPDVPARRLSRRAMRSYFRYWAEVFRLPVLGGDRIVDHMRVEDEHLLREAYAEGRGCILALPHMGNWDHAGAWLLRTGVPFTTVAERLRPEAVYDRFVEFREGIGMEVLPLTGGANTFAELARRLRGGAMLCLLADRDLTASGVVVDFFGEPARMPAGPAALALATGAALVPVTLWYPPEGTPGWRARIHPRVDPPEGGDRRAKVLAMTQALADAFEEGIAAHPADWHMLQPLWVADLDPRRPSGATSVSREAA
jgi:KDO2-lipid IV(A) lauroyltransferase